MPRFDTAALADIPEDTPVKASAGATDLVLIRQGDEVRAFTHQCPHLGLPLSKGVVRGDTLICAFHHACFDTRTGRQAQPPGHGDLRSYDVTLEDGRVWVDVPELPDGAEPHPLPAYARRGLDPRRFVIVGSGAAGEACALALREQGFEGQVEMISPDTRAPYDRTALSKAVLAGGKRVDDLTLAAADALAERDVTRIAGTVAAIEGSHVVLADGGRHAFDAVFLAPGGAPNVPDLPGTDLPGIHALRSADDGQRIAEAAAHASKAVLVGGGFIGLEAALSLAKRGLDVTVAIRDAVPLAKVLGERIGRAIMAEHEAKGVRFLTGAKVAGIEGTDRATGVALEDGTVLETDLVLLAVGVHPATGAIEGLPREGNGAVATGADLSVPGLPGVYVGGDCALAPTPFGPARIEHWRVARQHGIRAARAMLGAPSAPDDIPFFWTALGRQYRYVGHAEGWDDIRFDGDPAEAFVARYVKDGRVMAAVGAGRDADLARLHLDMKAAEGPLPA
ncbi:FAD-dependent oxidoreductase [uncultured Jannaschia sp.]|uniref:FAD-dependent oxidoreductase n=1 Tax=uncultured Jannaschia sp. TaxID=293347 RepID=UPI0026368588|nr:FAD-dependent oxidoreductase [uncultured Jannaschia sp.]